MTNIFLRQSEDLRNFLNDKFPVLAGAMAVQHFDKSFTDKGFTDRKLSKWKPVIDRKTKKPKLRPLVVTGHMRRGIDYDVKGSIIEVYNDVSYAKFHNDGGSIEGRPPQRQFMGSSQVLEQKIEDMIYDEIDNIFNSSRL